MSASLSNGLRKRRDGAVDSAVIREGVSEAGGHPEQELQRVEKR